jgi:hypothetical protein
MKKYLLFLIPLFLCGCGDKFDGLIDTSTTSYQVTFVNSSNDTLFVPGDSLIIVSISLISPQSIKSIYFNIMAPDGELLNPSPVPLLDDGNVSLHGDLVAGDNTFSNKYPFSQSFLNGKYTIQYFIVNTSDKVVLAAEHSFNYNNNIADLPPIVSNLVAPDTVSQLDTSKVIINISIAASDPNGAKDIQIVFYNSFLPNGNPSQQNPIIMYDDGTNGDAIAGDGIYSAIVQLPPKNAIPPVPLGTFRWEFQAQDRGKKTSNVIIHNIVIK